MDEEIFYQQTSVRLVQAGQWAGLQACGSVNQCTGKECRSKVSVNFIQ